MIHLFVENKNIDDKINDFDSALKTHSNSFKRQSRFLCGQKLYEVNFLIHYVLIAFSKNCSTYELHLEELTD